MMPRKKQCEKVDVISIDDVKTGQFITLRKDKKTYVVVNHNGIHKLIPIDLSNVINYDGLYNNVITRVFDAKNGDCIKLLNNWDGE